MAMIEEPRAIDYDSAGSVRNIPFDGWGSPAERRETPHVTYFGIVRELALAPAAATDSNASRSFD
jgi:hypothetical protein